MVVGDGKPFIAALITLDPEALDQWKRDNGKDAAALTDLATDPAIRTEIQQAVDDANSTVSKAEQIKKFAILDTDLNEESGHVTPSLKIKRNIVHRDFAKEIDSLYS
jgi:Long-chain acyl-CoA synthetases (AMP-forming)